jgi:hypothetical protein
MAAVEAPTPGHSCINAGPQEGMLVARDDSLGVKSGCQQNSCWKFRKLSDLIQYRHSDALAKNKIQLV